MKKIYALLIFVSAFAGCKKGDDQPAPSGNSGLTVNSTPQVNFKLDGAAVSIIQGSTYEQYVTASKSIASWPDSSSASWTSYFQTVASMDPVFLVEKGYLHYMGFNPDSSSFYDFYAPSTVTYVSNPETQLGMRLTYYISGTEWSTSLGSGNQAGSSFTIESRKKVSFSGDLYVSVLAHFNCKLYDGLGNTKTVTEGVFVGSFANI